MARTSWSLPVLSRPGSAASLLPVLLQRVRPGLHVGLIAASATAGVVVAYGWRTRGALRPFAEVGRFLLSRASATGPSTVAGPTLLGVLFHTLVIVAWGMLFATVASRLRGLMLVIASILCAAAAFGVHSMLPALLRPGYDAMAIQPQLAVHVMLALALAIGMRLAQSGSRIADSFR